jgi:hypothetical protein
MTAAFVPCARPNTALGLDDKGVEAFLFQCLVSVTTQRLPQRNCHVRKSHMELGNRLRAIAPAVCFPGRAVRLWGSRTPSLSVRRPTNAVQENGAYGGQGKAAGGLSLAPAASLSEINPFVLAVTSRKIEAQSSAFASAIRGR